MSGLSNKPSIPGVINHPFNTLTWALIKSFNLSQQGETYVNVSNAQFICYMIVIWAIKNTNIQKLLYPLLVKLQR